MSCKIRLDKYEYLSCEDLGYKSNVFEKAKLEYSLLGMSLNKELKKIDQFKDMSISSNHTIMKNFLSLKTLNQQNQKQLKKERIMKNVEEVYRKYYDAYKDKYDSSGEFNGPKNWKFDYKQFKIVNKTEKESKLDEETKNFIKVIKKREKGVDKKRFSRYFNYEPSALVSILLS